MGQVMWPLIVCKQLKGRPSSSKLLTRDWRWHIYLLCASVVALYVLPCQQEHSMKWSVLHSSGLSFGSTTVATDGFDTMLTKVLECIKRFWMPAIDVWCIVHGLQDRGNLNTAENETKKYGSQKIWKIEQYRNGKWNSLKTEL